MAFNAGSVVAKIKADVSDFQDGVKKAQTSLGDFKKNVTTNLTAVRNTAAIASGAIAAVGAATFSLANSAGKYESIRDAFEGMTDGMGFSVEEFEQKVSDASRGTIDRLTALTGANKAMSLIGKQAFSDFGNDFAEMAALSKKAARATGQDVGFMFDSLITGVARSSKLILDNLGITVNMADAQSKYADELMKTNGLTEDQAMKASLMKVVMEELQTTYADVEVSGGGFQGAMQALNATLENTKIELGLALIPLFNELVRSITPLVKEYTPKLIELLTKLVNWFQNLDPRMQKIILAFIALAPVITIVTTLILAIIPVITALLSPIGLVIMAVVALAAAWYYNWDRIKSEATTAWEFIKRTFNTALSWVTGWGGKLMDELTRPFRDAWNTIEGLINKIKDGLDFTKRHSPSVVDIVTKGVNAVNKAMGNLDFNTTLSPQVTANSISPTGGTRMVSVSINMDGAIISDALGAERIAERIGDSIISKLQSSVRF